MMSEAWAMTRGQILYRDISQIHPVLNFAVFVPFFAWLKPAVAPHAIKALNAALVFGGACLARRLVARWTSDRDCALAAALLFAGLLGSDWALSSFGEFYMIFPILLSAVLMQKEKPPWFAVGLLWGTAFFLKQVAVFDAAALAVGFILLRRRPAAELARSAALIAAGGAALTAAAAVYFVRNGALSEAVDAVFLRALAYRSLPGLPLLVRAGFFGHLILKPALLDFAPCWILAGSSAAAWLLARRSSKETSSAPAGPLALCLLWLVLNLYGVWSVGKMHLHYVLALVAPACLLAGLGLRAAPPAFRPAARRALTAVLVAAAAWTCWPRLRGLAAQDWIDARTRGSYEIAARIRQYTREDQRIFLYGINNLDAFYLSERLSSNGIYMYLSMEEAFLNKPELVERERRQMRESPPALMIVNNTPGFNGASAATREFFSRLLLERYERVASEGVADFYRLKAP
jgi:hypothetical protein